MATVAADFEHRRTPVHVLPARRRAEALETQILELCGHINAANALFLSLIREFDREEYWNGAGMASCAQWLNLHCGLGMTAARERLRVARALEELPEVSAAFSRGELVKKALEAAIEVLYQDSRRNAREAAGPSASNVSAEVPRASVSAGPSFPNDFVEAPDADVSAGRSRADVSAETSGAKVSTGTSDSTSGPTPTSILAPMPSDSESSQSPAASSMAASAWLQARPQPRTQPQTLG